MVTSSAVVGSSAISSLRVAGDRHGDHHALVHAAGELVRKGAEPALRRRDADLLQQLDRAPRAPPCGPCPRAARSVSASWKPTVKHGLRLVVGSWKIIAMSLPISRAALARRTACSRSLPVEAQPVGARRGRARRPGPSGQHGRRSCRSRIRRRCRAPRPRRASGSTPSTARNGPCVAGTRPRGS